MSDRADPARARLGIDPRGPRFAAGVTALLLLLDVFLGLAGISTARWASLGLIGSVPEDGAGSVIGGAGFVLPATTIVQRMLDPAFLLMAIIWALFLWGILSPRTAPWGVLYRRLIQPRLRPAVDLEDPRPPRFAQGVGLLVVSIGLLLQLLGAPWGLPIAAAAAFVAAFLNAVFGLCLGCQLYLVLQRAGIIGRGRPAAA